MSQMSETLRKKRQKLEGKFIYRKRESVKPSTLKSDVYVTNKCNFKRHLEKVEKLWADGQESITIRGLGAAIPRSINLALQFQRNHYNVLDLDVRTDTVNLVDDLEPLTDDNDYETNIRCNSSICIKLIRKIALNSNSE